MIDFICLTSNGARKDICTFNIITLFASNFLQSINHIFSDLAVTLQNLLSGNKV